MGALSANDIDSSVRITGDVKVGRNNKILPYAVLEGPLEIGDDNWIGPHVYLGSRPTDRQKRVPKYADGYVKIGDRNIIREFTSVQQPTCDRCTLVGSDVQLMQGACVSHDTIIQDKVVLAAHTATGGLVRIMEGAFIAMGARIHQYGVVGAYSIAGMGAAVVKNIPPFSRYIPGKPITVNTYLVKDFGFSEFLEEIEGAVLHGKMPSSRRIKKYFDDFEELHLISKRGRY